MENTEEQMEAVANGLEISSKYNLQVEVFVWAMKAIKENPELSISEAVTIGVDEWVK